MSRTIKHNVSLKDVNISLLGLMKGGKIDEREN